MGHALVVHHAERRKPETGGGIRGLGGVEALHRRTEETTPRWIQLVLYEVAAGIVDDFPGDRERRGAVRRIGHELDGRRTCRVDGDRSGCRD